MATAKGIVTKVKNVVTEFFSPGEASKSPSRVAAGKKAAKTRARKAAANKAVTTKVSKAAAKKAVQTKVRKAAKKKVAPTRANAAAGATKKVAAKKAPAAKRELIAPKGDKRFIRRDATGRIKESDDVGRSLSQDVRKAAKTATKPGQGDKGDRKPPKRAE